MFPSSSWFKKLSRTNMFEKLQSDNLISGLRCLWLSGLASRIWGGQSSSFMFGGFVALKSLED